MGEKTRYGYRLDQTGQETQNLLDAIDHKVDKEPGKGLSTEDYTSEEKAKLESVENGAQANVIEGIKRNGETLTPTDKVVNIAVPERIADLSDDYAHRTVTDAEKAAWDAKQNYIGNLIPAEASASNKLADKDFVNSSIATQTSTFQGTYESVGDLPTTGVDNNDYAYVVTTDSAGNTLYNRYKFNGTTWEFEYSLNNSSFTAAEWAAIQSGMTAALRQKLERLNPNWNESDDSSPAYINNRTHYEYIIAEMLHVELSNYEEKFRDGHLVIEASYVNYNQSRTDYDIVQSIPVSAWVYDPAIHGGAYVASDYGLMIWIDDPDPIQYTFGSMHIERPSTGQSSEFYNVVYPDGSLDSLVRNYATSEIRLSYIYKLSNMFLDMDSTPTTGSGKPVTSGGVKAAIANFITKSVNDLTNYYLKSETYTKAEVESLIGAIQNFHYEIYASTSEVTSPAPNVLYLIGPTGSGTDKYEEYVYANSSWVKIGDTSIDLSGFVTTEALTAALANYVTSSAFTQALATKQDVIDAQHKLDYSLLSNTPEIPDPEDFATKEEVSQLRSEVAEKDGYYPEMSVGSLVGTEVTQVEGITTIAKSTGLAKINEVMGRSLVWNQLVKNGDFSDGLTDWNQSGVIATVNADDITIHGTSESYAAQNLNQVFPPISGHKYLLSFVYKCDNSTVAYFANNNGIQIPASESFVEKKQIITSDGYGYLRFYPSVGGNYSPSNNLTLKKRIVVHDLTQLFQPGNEPSTVAEFESWLANNIGYRDYYAYNAGEIISNNTEALEITGLNQLNLLRTVEYNTNRNPGDSFDFITENMIIKGIATNGYIRASQIASYSLENNSVKVKTSTDSSSVSYGLGFPVRMLPNTEYSVVFEKSSSGASVSIARVDISGKMTLIADGISSGRTLNSGNYPYLIIILRPNASNTEVTFSNLCFFVSGSRNGEYEPYQKSELELNLSTITGKLNGEGESVTIFPEGMRSAGSAFDSLIVDEDGWCRKAIRRFEKVDLGSLSWTYNTSGQGAFSSNTIRTLVGSCYALCPKYVCNYVTAKPASMDDKMMAINKSPAAISGNFNVGAVVINDSAYSDAAIFTTAVSGVPLIYELATPQEYVLDTPIYMGIKTQQGGVIWQKPENGSAPTTAPMRMSVTYALPPEALMSEGSIRNMLEALKAAGKINTYTMAWDYTIGKWTFSFT